MAGYNNKVSRIFDEFQVRAGIKHGSSQYKKFVILSDARCGSTLLMNLLRSHPNVVCFSEVFNYSRIIWASKIYGFSFKSPTLKTERDSDPQRFLATYVFREYSKNIRAVGFKLKYRDILRGQALLLEKIIKRYPDVHIIHLRRHNQLDRIIAQRISGLTRSKSEVDAHSLQEKLRAVLPFKLEYEECLRGFKKVSAKSEAANVKLRQVNCSLMDVDYACLSNNTDESMARVVSALSLPPKRLFTNQIKQEPDRMRDSIANYDELKAAFQDTEWYKYFTE